jgi:3',5'-cyclic AMP phosphodiesterase CpdA
MASVRILHASDLHIANQENITSPADRFTPGTIKDAAVNRMLASSYDSGILLHLARFAYQQAQKGMLDAILLTGDISTTGSREDLQKSVDFIHEPAEHGLGWQNAMGQARLADVGVPVWLLPGNHDRYETTFYGYVPGGNEFDDVFQNDWQGPVMCYDPITKSGLTVTVIAADFNLKRSRDSERILGWLAQGKVYDEILNELEATTKGLPRYARQCVIWAMHFPPAYPKVSPYLELLDSELLILRANDCGIKAVLAGHTHDAVKYRRPNMKFDVFCAGTVSQAFAPEGNHFRIIEINSDGAGNVSINSEEYRFNKVMGGIITNRSGFRRV